MANLSGTKCPKCEHKGFELVEDEPANSNWKHMYLRCSSCKSFLGILYMNNTNILIEQLQEDVRKIKQKLGVY